MIRKFVIWVLGLLAVAIAGLWLNWQMSTPSHARDWQPLYERQPTVEMVEGVYELRNVRDWSYTPDGGTTPSWMTARLDPSALTRVWFIEEPFGDMRAVAHTMIAFEFDDGAAYVASVEARREVGESYGGLKAGFLPMHEYLVFWTTERDMYANSTYYTGDDLYLFPLELPDDAGRAVLAGMMQLTEELETRPRWYNTFFSNCTNVLARAVNEIAPDAVPWNMAWYLPGYAAEFLYNQGLVAGEGNFSQVRSVSHLTPHVSAAYQNTSPPEFSRAIRQIMSHN